MITRERRVGASGAPENSRRLSDHRFRKLIALCPLGTHRAEVHPAGSLLAKQARTPYRWRCELDEPEPNKGVRNWRPVASQGNCDLCRDGSGACASQSPHLVTPEGITNSAIGAAKAGAAIVHLHARNPETGKRPRRPTISGVHSRNQGTLQRHHQSHRRRLSGMTLEARTAAARRLSPEMCSLNMGSMNFARTRWPPASRNSKTNGKP